MSRLPTYVPKGLNVNSRGLQPTVAQPNTSDPYGVAQFLERSSVGFTHGYSCLAALRPAILLD